MEILFWQNMLSDHQAAHIRALAERGHCVTIVADEGLSAMRRKMRCAEPDFGRAPVVVDPDREDVRRLVRDASREAIHIIGGYRGYRVGPQALQDCITLSTRVGLMAESGNVSDGRRLPRLLRWQVERARFGHRLDFILAMGQLGVRWFEGCGYSRDRIYAYGYFTEPPANWQEEPVPSASIELVYIGQLIPRKGIDILLHSLAQLRSQAWRLTIMGEGPLKKDLARLAGRLGISDRVGFHPFGPKEEVYRLINRADALVLPSRFDGWGVVVNEALLCGVPVICTDRCGASDLLRNDWRGLVVESGSVDELAAALRTIIKRGKRMAELTARIRSWSRCIYGNSAAAYLIGVLDHIYNGGPRPIPPWYND